MAKKMRAKEKREKKKEQDQARYRQQAEEARKAKEEAERLKREEAYQKELSLIRKEQEQAAKEQDETLPKKKSKAKAAGLKSTFTLTPDRLLMTSFGAGNAALLDKYITGEEITSVDENSILSVASQDATFQVSGRTVKNAIVVNPLHLKDGSTRKPGDDLIHCRDKLEIMYFGRKFQDNIHIQLIYNILDIEKVLAVQVNNIVFSLNNLLRRSESEYTDLIGYLGLRYTYETFRKENPSGYYDLFSELVRSPRMRYFGNTFLAPQKCSEEDWIKYEKKCYHLFAILGTVRQATAHGAKKTRSRIYKLGPEYDDPAKNSDSCRVDARRDLDTLYKERVHELNSGFLDKSKKDLTILFHAFKADNDHDKKALVQEYYEFVVLKNYKNLGFSIRRLRETIIAREAGADILSDTKYDTVRSKLYRAMDFKIYLYYQEHPEKAKILIECLRASTEEAEKEWIYRREASAVWNNIRDVITKEILPRIDGTYIKNLKPDSLDPEMLDGVLIPETAHSFSEMIYLLTIFLDGKEINDLLTQLINRFENINSFLEVMKKESLPTNFQKDYEIFAQSSQIAKELRTINSFARMTQPAPAAKKALFEEAAQLLGYLPKEKKLGQYLDDMLTPGQKKEENGHGFRNFIINNVIESTRFKYLVRYGNPQKMRALASNRKVIDFVLKDIPDTQITSYYNSCKGGKSSYSPDMRESLAEIITGLHFNDFEDVYQANTDDSNKKEDKERRKNIIRLYLTVLYLLLKNLIYINSRYFLAFHCAERDAMVYDSKIYNEDVLREDRACFAKAFIEKYPPNKRAEKYIKQNFEHADTWSLRTFRNCTEHLNAIRNADKYIGDIASVESYFALYHYLVQRSIMDKFEYDKTKPSKNNLDITNLSENRAGGKLLQYFELIRKHGTYCKDFVKALNVPFAYNLPRYKNLSIQELFDRNHYRPYSGRDRGMELRSEEDS